MSKVRIRPGDALVRRGIRTVVTRVDGNTVRGFQERVGNRDFALQVEFHCDADYWLHWRASARANVSPEPPPYTHDLGGEGG